MKKLMNILKTKCSMVKVVNMCALSMVIYTAASTCMWAHHQPEVPDAVRRFRKF